jgi:hypothetical protein
MRAMGKHLLSWSFSDKEKNVLQHWLQQLML